MKYPFVAFGSMEANEDDEWLTPDPCAACHRAEFANVSRMYLAGDGYDSNGVSSYFCTIANGRLLK